MESNTEYDDINEAEEEALLKSDEESMEDNVSDASDDSLDSSDSDEATSEEIIDRFNKLVKEIQKQPYLYEKYLELCQLSHSTNDLDCIRKAYNMFSAIFPMTPDLWLQFIKIEEDVATSPEEIKRISEMFRKATSDYYSFDLGLRFGYFGRKTENPEEIWEEVLGTCGLECLRGNEAFKSYRQYLTKNSKMSEEEKSARYIHSFKQELQYPLFSMEESYVEFKVSCEKNKPNLPTIDWDKIDKKYFEAKDHLDKILPYEENLKKLNINAYRERADVYMDYIKSLEKFLNEKVLQIVYERMVRDCCLIPECWLSYIEYIALRDGDIDRSTKVEKFPLFQQTATDVNRRALRNCTWSEKLYIKMMQLLEKQGATREEVQEVLESSMSAGFQSPEPLVAIWLEYLTYLRRHTNWEDESECDILRKNFSLGWTILGKQWGVLADCNCEILQFWGRLEYGPLKDPNRGKELWNLVMESSFNATKSGLWIEFAQLEMRRDLAATRRLYQKALNSKGLDNPAVIASAWERFERCNGTVKSLINCQKECSKFMKQYSMSKEPQSVVNDRSMSAGKRLPGKAVKRKTNAVPNGSETKKLKPQDASLPDQTRLQNSPREKKRKLEEEFRGHETQEIDVTKDNKRIFLSNLDYNLNEDEIREHLGELKIKSIDLIRSGNGRSRGFGYLELEDEAEVEKAIAMDRRNINGRPVFISSVLRDKERRQKFKYSDSLEPNKIFIKGLPHDTTKEELEQIFSPFGELKDTRLVYHKSGNFKNIAYVEFKEESSAGKAVLGSNQMELRGHRLNVAISAPPPKPMEGVINTEKLLGLTGNKRSKMEQKPRMSFIPTAVRKNFANAATTSSNGTKFQGKTNADFRSLLQNKN